MPAIVLRRGEPHEKVERLAASVQAYFRPEKGEFGPRLDHGRLGPLKFPQKMAEMDGSRTHPGPYRP